MGRGHAAGRGLRVTHAEREWLQYLERRAYSRVRRDMKVGCRVLDATSTDSTCQALDVSRGGVRLRSSRKLSRGQGLQLTFHSKPYNFDVALTGTIVWAEAESKGGEYEIGVQFDELTAPQSEAVLAVVGRPEQDDGKEQRRFIRLRNYLSVEIRKVRGLWRRKAHGLVQNVGLDGIAVEADRGYRPDTICSVRMFLLTDTDPARVRARVLGTCKLKGVHSWFMRLRFEDFEEDARAAIGRFLCAEMEQAMSQK